MSGEYCIEDIVAINVIIDSIGYIDNIDDIRQFLYEASLDKQTHIKILQLAFEGAPIFITLMYKNHDYHLLIDALNTSSTYEHKRVGNKLINKYNLGRKTYELYNNENFIETAFWHK